MPPKKMSAATKKTLAANKTVKKAKAKHRKPGDAVKASILKARATIAPIIREYNGLREFGEVANRSYAIFDLDGCISDDSYRHSRINADASNNWDRYDEYHSYCGSDLPLIPGAQSLRNAIEAGITPIFITARPEKWRGETRDWLLRQFHIRDLDSYAKNLVGHVGFLFMRLNTDERDSVEIKKDIVKNVLNLTRSNSIIAAYDDREDIITMYNAVYDIQAFICDKDGVRDHLGLHKPVQIKQASPRCDDHPARKDYNDVGDLLASMAETFRERNAAYGNNGIKVGDVFKVLFPNGVRLESAADQRIYHLFSLLIVKLTRFANSGM